MPLSSHGIILVRHMTARRHQPVDRSNAEEQRRHYLISLVDVPWTLSFPAWVLLARLLYSVRECSEWLDVVHTSDQWRPIFLLQ